MPMNELGKTLLGIGLLISFVGVLLCVASRTGFPLGKLPGDFAYRSRRVSIFFPLVTSILISIVVSLLLYLISRFRR
jgi:hypothetical protein